MKDKLRNLAGTRALVVGDLMLDTHYWGHVSRMSPEAPVPVLAVERIEQRPGGAGNVVNNLYSLKAKVSVAGVLGKDVGAAKLLELLADEEADVSGIIEDENRPTTEKIRMIKGTEHLLRCDLEKTEDLSHSKEALILDHIRRIIDQQNIEVVILQDYNKGVLTAAVIQESILMCRHRNIPVAVDPKSKNFFAYKGCTLFKPNLKEVREALSIEINPTDINSLNTAADELLNRLECEKILITLSEHGAFYAGRNGERGLIPAHPRMIVDVSGAGDTVISIAALCLAKAFSLTEIAMFANLGGGLVCEHPGVMPLDLEELILEAVK